MSAQKQTDLTKPGKLAIEIRHRLPMWSYFIGSTKEVRSGYKRTWRGYVCDALMAAGVPLLCNARKQWVYTGAPIKVGSVVVTQILSKGQRGYDRTNLGSIVDKMVYDNLVHLGVLSDDNHRVMPDAKTEYEQNKYWCGVRVEIIYLPGEK